MFERLGPAPLPLRVVAAVAVLLLHFPLLFLGYRAREPHRDARERTLQLRFIKPSQPSVSERPVLSPPIRSRAIMPRERSTAAPSTPPADPLPRVAPDWDEEAARAAGHAVADILKRESYRALGPEAKRPTYELPEAPSMYRRPKHKYGEVGEDPFGQDAVWHNERCYTRLEEPVTPRPSADIEGVNPMKCMWSGPRKPRGDLFEHLQDKKPDPPR